jgi:hypothetical protein
MMGTLLAEPLPPLLQAMLPGGGAASALLILLLVSPLV